jgi:uncharacterized paraquat-inducible protein A
MEVRCPVCGYPVAVHHLRKGKVVRCEECKRELKLIKEDSWDVTIFEREKEGRFL